MSYRPREHGLEYSRPGIDAATSFADRSMPKALKPIAGGRAQRHHRTQCVNVPALMDRTRQWVLWDVLFDPDNRHCGSQQSAKHIASKKRSIVQQASLCRTSIYANGAVTRVARVAVTRSGRLATTKLPGPKGRHSPSRRCQPPVSVQAKTADRPAERAASQSASNTSRPPPSRNWLSSYRRAFAGACPGCGSAS